MTNHILPGRIPIKTRPYSIDHETATSEVNSPLIFYTRIEEIANTGTPMVRLYFNKGEAKKERERWFLGKGFLHPQGGLKGHGFQHYESYNTDRQEALSLLPEIPSDMVLGRPLFVRATWQHPTKRIYHVEPALFLAREEKLQSVFGTSIATYAESHDPQAVRNLILYTRDPAAPQNALGVVKMGNAFKRVRIEEGAQRLGEACDVRLLEENGSGTLDARIDHPRLLPTFMAPQK